MADTNRAPSPRLAALEAGLRDAITRLDFGQVLRRIESAHPELPRLGEAVRAAAEPVRLGQKPDLAFAVSALNAFLPATATRRARLLVNFFGLLGPNGPLPLHLSEFAHERQHNHGDPTFSRFLDIFHHRLLTFFYRAWANGEPAVNHDRPATDRFAGYVAALIGQLLPSVRGADAFPDRAKLHYAGWLSLQPRNAEGLAAIVTDHFQMPAQIETFVGGWIDLPESMRWRLGRTPDTAGTLGVNTTVGARAWHCAHKFRVVLGPLSREAFDRMLPGGSGLQRLVALVRYYAGDQLDWDVRLILDQATERAFALGKGTRLGWDSWLRGPGSARVGREDTILDPLGTEMGRAA